MIIVYIYMYTCVYHLSPPARRSARPAGDIIRIMIIIIIIIIINIVIMIMIIIIPVSDK